MIHGKLKKRKLKMSNRVLSSMILVKQGTVNNGPRACKFINITPVIFIHRIKKNKKIQLVWVNLFKNRNLQ